jgi:DNA-binding MarR family transcriptional regulator
VAVVQDYPSHHRGAAIGARLRRLSERIDREANAIYAEMDIEFEQRWFGVLNQLALSGPMSVGELAAVLGVSHAAVSQTRASLIARELIETEDDPADARRRVLALSPAGKRLVKRLEPLWAALSQTGADLDREAGGVVDALDRLEAVIDERPLAQRVRTKLKT